MSADLVKGFPSGSLFIQKIKIIKNKKKTK